MSTSSWTWTTLLRIHYIEYCTKFEYSLNVRRDVESYDV